MMSPGERKNEDPMKSVIPGGTGSQVRGTEAAEAEEKEEQDSGLKVGMGKPRFFKTRFEHFINGVQNHETPTKVFF